MPLTSRSTPKCRPGRSLHLARNGSASLKVNVGEFVELAYTFEGDRLVAKMIYVRQQDVPGAPIETIVLGWP